MPEISDRIAYRKFLLLGFVLVLLIDVRVRLGINQVENSPEIVQRLIESNCIVNVRQYAFELAQRLHQLLVIIFLFCLSKNSNFYNQNEQFERGEISFKLPLLLLTMFPINVKYLDNRCVIMVRQSGIWYRLRK